MQYRPYHQLTSQDVSATRFDSLEPTHLMGDGR